MRKLEALPEYDECAIGEWPEFLDVIEGGVRFRIDPRDSQKTGWFYDQRDNRDRLPKLVKGKRVLDVFRMAAAGDCAPRRRVRTKWSASMPRPLRWRW